jgi:hypothetical protein
MSDDRSVNVADTAGVAETVRPDAPAVVLPPAVPASMAANRDKMLDAYHATLASVGESQRAIASETAAMTLELDAIARSTLSATGDGVTALLRAKNMADAVEIPLSVARKTFPR